MTTLLAARPADAETAWGRCCAPDAGTDPAARFPWFRFALGLVVAGQTMLLGLAINLTPPENESTRFFLQGGMLLATLLVVALLGTPLLLDAARALRRLRPTMELLFLVCLAGSLALSVQSFLRGTGPVYFEVVAVLLIVYSVGRAVGAHGRRRALASMRSLVDALSTARRTSPEGEEPVALAALRPGDRIRVLPGELIPVDGRIEAGEAFVRETAFTGEWTPRRRGPGDRVLAATLCEDGPLVIAPGAAGAVARRVDRLADALERARAAPTSLQRQADRFVGWFLPLVLVAALATLLWWWPRAGAADALHHALAVLLVACPCAAGLAAPLVFWTLLGRLARRGLVLRSGDALERLAGVDRAVFDKTGTLGDERLEVEAFEVLAGDPAQVRAVVSAVERASTHPVAAALAGLAPPADARAVTVRHVRPLPGRGIEALVAAPQPHTVRIVREDPPPAPGALGLRVDLDGHPAARARVRERLRAGAKTAVDRLRALGVAVEVMTGDGAAAIAPFAPARTAMTPEDKLAAVRAAQQCGRVLFVGDGLNDAAAMAAAHAGVALAQGSAVACETADATLHGGDLPLVADAVALARHAVRRIRSNLRWAVCYNLVGIAAAASGHLHPVLAALLMAGSSALVCKRSFLVAGREPVPVAPPRVVRTEKTIPAGPRARRAFAALHVFALAGQGCVLARLAGFAWPGTLALAAVFALAAFALLRCWPRMPAWADMTFSMVSLGGLGMNLGWWLDLGFVAGGAACSCHAAGHGLWNGMNLGMLALGVPAMFLVRHTWQRFDWRRWCCSGMLLLGVPGMVLGMRAGSMLAGGLATGLDPQAMVVLDYAGMMAGMCLGMLVPHMLEAAR